MLPNYHYAHATRCRPIAYALIALFLGMALAACGGAQTQQATRPAPPPGWSECPRPVFGVGCQLPDDWSLNESDPATFANPKPPGDDAIVLFVKLPDGDASAPDVIVSRYLPLRDVRYASRDKDATSLAGAKVSEGTATVVDNASPVRFWSYRIATASGTIAVALVLKSAATARSGATMTRIASSLRIAEPPRPVEKTVPHDLAGRPLPADQDKTDGGDNGAGS